MAKNSPEGEKSSDRGAFLNLTQSMRHPVMMSQTLMQLSSDEASNHLASGCENERSVILFMQASSKNLTLFKSALPFRSVIDRSEHAMATRSLTLL